MDMTIMTIARSLADYLAPVLPGVTFYEDPNQQDSQTPMLFLQVRSSDMEIEAGGFWKRRLSLDLVYMESYNIPDMQARYQAAGEALDLVMETFPYSDGVAAPVLLRTRQREWRIDADALHYRFDVVVRVHIPKDGINMRTMGYHAEVL